MNKLIVFFISMLPIIELRGAIPYSQYLKVNLLDSFIIAIIGNIIPIVFIFLFAKKLLFLGQKFKISKTFCDKILKKGHNLGSKLENKVGIALYISIFIFVAVPLPGTGIWTATLAASLLDLDLKKTFISCSLGVIVSGIIMSILSYGLFSLLF